MNWSRMMAIASLAIGMGSVGLRAADVFEGFVTMKLTTPKAKAEGSIKYSVKEPKVRMDMAQGRDKAGIIIDQKAKVILILSEQEGEKFLIRQPIPEDPTGGKGEKASEPVATGRTEMIAGYQAAEYVVTEKDKTSTQLWLGKGLGAFFMSMGDGPGMAEEKGSPAWEKWLKSGDFFPLRVVSLNAKGVEISRMEVTKIEKAKVPESTFSTEGYREMNIPGMFGGMGR